MSAGQVVPVTESPVSQEQRIGGSKFESELTIELAPRTFYINRKYISVDVICEHFGIRPYFFFKAH